MIFCFGYPSDDSSLSYGKVDSQVGEIAAAVAGGKRGNGCRSANFAAVCTAVGLGDATVFAQLRREHENNLLLRQFRTTRNCTASKREGVATEDESQNSSGKSGRGSTSSLQIAFNTRAFPVMNLRN
jgi:hypothetical protein